MALITVEGVPDNVGKGKMSILLKTMVFKDEHFDFWVQKYKGSMYKKADIKFKTVEQAEKAKQKLHGFNLMYNSKTYQLSCYKLQVTPVYDYQTQAPNGKSSENQTKTKTFFDRDRSRSPMSDFSTCNEISKVDKEIELIRKQRILVEEERKLLLEKKKLQILKNLKISNIKELQLFESVSDVASPAEVESVPSPKNDEKTLESLPGYLRLSRVIYSQMRTVIKKHITQENSYKLRKLINATIKQRLAVFLEGKTYVKLQSVLAQYRHSHPLESDETLLKELSKTIEQTDSHATANELQTQETTNDGQAESGIEVEGGNKGKEKFEEPPELNEDVDMENDFDDWTDDEPEKPDIDLTEDTKMDDCTIDESVDFTEHILNEDNASQENAPVTKEDNVSQDKTLVTNEDRVSQENNPVTNEEKVMEPVAETPKVNTNSEMVAL